MQAVPLGSWLVPCLLLCGGITALAVLLELRLTKLMRSGAATRSNAGPALPSSFPFSFDVKRVKTGSGIAKWAAAASSELRSSGGTLVQALLAHDHRSGGSQGSNPSTPGSADLHFRGGRHSTPSGPITGFPGKRSFAGEHC